MFDGEFVATDQGTEQKRAFCQNCDFIKWGTWGARLDYGQAKTEDVHLGWWIGGDVVSDSDMPVRGSAVYNGDVIGNVASKQGAVWDQYVATGDLRMDWSFTARTGVLQITNFDGNKSFGGLMLAPGSRAEFNGGTPR